MSSYDNPAQRGGEAVGREAVSAAIGSAANPTQVGFGVVGIEKAIDAVLALLAARGDAATPTVSAEQRDGAVWSLIENDGTWYDGDPSPEHHSQRVDDVNRVLAALGIEVTP